MVSDQYRLSERQKLCHIALRCSADRVLPKLAAPRRQKARHMQRCLHVTKGVMGAFMGKAIERGELVEPEPAPAIGAGRIRKGALMEKGSRPDQGQEIHAGIAVGHGEVGWMKRLPEGALQHWLVKPHGVVTHGDSRPPVFQALANPPHHVIEGRQIRLGQKRRANTGHSHRPGRRNHPGQQTAADVEPVDLFQGLIGQDRCELQNLIKVPVRARGFGVEKTIFITVILLHSARKKHSMPARGQVWFQPAEPLDPFCASWVNEAC